MPSSVFNMFNQVEMDLKNTAKKRSQDWFNDRLQNGSYVYGAGSFGRRIVALLAAQGFPCLGVIDRRANAEFKNLGEIPILHPESLTFDKCKNHNFILGIFNPFDDMGEVIQFARECGFNQIFWGADLPDALGPTLNDFWLSGRQIFIDHFDRIYKLSELLSDQTSIDTLRAMIRFRALDDDKPSPPPSFGTQYFPLGLPGFNQPITLLDGGAYDGDTFRSLIGFGVEIKHWVAFEPDPSNFKQLVARGQDCGTRADFIPCGLSDRLHQVQFSAGNETGSRIVSDAASANVTIQCVAIDEMFTGTAFDYVKLDIEGAESAALKGMAKTIEKSRPRLAISAYHRPQDLWEIPLQLAAALPDSDIYLRHHFPNSYELVAYALPRYR